MQLQQISHLKSNDPLLLDDRDHIWHLMSGSVALFAIYKGRRRYLFTLKAGDFLFPTMPAQQSQLCMSQLLAIALEETELTPFSIHSFQDWMLQAPQAAIAGLEGWITRLSQLVTDLQPPLLPTPIAQSGILATQEIFQPHQSQISWCRLCSGQARLLGWHDLTLTPAMGRIPLMGNLWLQATERVELDHCSYHQIPQPQTFLRGLQSLQQWLVHLLTIRLQQEQQEELKRLQLREIVNQEAIEKTNQEFIKVFQKRNRKNQYASGQVVIAENTLLMAAGAVGHALGVPITPPGESEDWRQIQNPLDAIARASCLRTRRVTLRDRWWQKDCGPLLAYLGADEHPVALLPIADGKYEIYNPLAATRSRCNQKTAAQLAPTAYSFYRPLPDLLRPIDLLQFATRRHQSELMMILAAGIFSTLLGMVTPQATAFLIDQAIPNANRTLVFQMALGLIAVAFGSLLFQLVQGFAIMRLETFADSATQAAVWDRLLKLQPAFFRQYSIGDLSSRVSAISQIRQRLGSTILKSLFSGIFSFLNLGLLFFYSTPLALIALLAAAINIAVTVISGIVTLKKTKPLLDRQGKLFGVMVQLINGVSKFRIAGAESRAFAFWGQQYSQQLNLMLATQGIEDNLAVIHSLLSAITPALLFAVATHLLVSSKGEFSTATFLAFNSAFGTFIGGATSLSTIVIDILEILPIWQRAQPILQAVPEVSVDKADPGRLSGRIAIAHAMFRYRPDGAMTLNDVSIHAEPGEFIALVGPSGSGKSTLLRLLLGFDTLESGVVSFDGQDLMSLNVNAVRRQLGVVMQNSRLMSASMFENIAGNALISMDEAWEAARMAGLAEDIEAMPMGMHTVVSEGGSNLSGGQRQRLLIAKALARRPKILLFDEATSALDNRTQQIVSDSLDRLKVTRIVVAHRLSTIRNADRIYVLEKGRLIQQGSFDQLAAEPGLFQQLVQRQKV
ncbi:MAG: NHLP bacteriocin export ABC transporter permease/ATPase subunit [Synechococcales bacterium]|nr:NHLP bacteriocin export ABC transporter permease/ATPase subunit [Synechococcales bacterium]